MELSNGAARVPGTNGHVKPGRPPAPEPAEAPGAPGPPPTDDRLRGKLLRAAARLLAGARAGRGPLTVIVKREGVRVVLTALPGELAGPGLPGDLTPGERKVLRAATDRPQQLKVLASRAGYRLNSYFRGIVRGLCRRDPPLLERVGNDYRLPTL